MSEKTEVEQIALQGMDEDPQGVEGTLKNITQLPKRPSIIDRVGSMTKKPIQVIKDDDLLSKVKEKDNLLDDEAKPEDWANSGKIVFYPAVLLAIFSLFPLSFQENPTLQNSYLFIFGFHFIYHLVAVYFGFVLFGLFIPPPSRQRIARLTVFGGLLGCGFDFLAIWIAGSTNDLFGWIVPFSVTPAALMIFVVMYRKTKRMQEYLIRVLDSSDEDSKADTNRAVSRYMSGRFSAVDVNQSDQDTGDDDQHQGKLPVTFVGENGKRVQIFVDVQSLLDAPLAIYIRLVFFAVAVLITYVACIFYSFWFLQQDTDEGKLLVSTLFPWFLFPFQAALSICGKQLDGQQSEVRLFYAKIARIKPKGMRKKKREDVDERAEFGQAKEVSADLAGGLQMKYLALWTGRMFQSLYFRSLFLGLKSYDSFVTLLLIEVTVTLFFYWIRLFGWWFRYIEKPVGDWVSSRGSELLSTACFLATKVASDPSKKPSQSQRVAQLKESRTNKTLSTRLQQENTRRNQRLSVIIRNDKPVEYETEEDLFQGDLLRHRTNVLRRYYWFAMAQRFSVISFLAMAGIMRSTWNAPFFGFRDAIMSNTDYQRILEFGGIMLGLEWVLASVLWKWHAARYGLDLIRIGAQDLRDKRFMLTVLLIGVHISQDVLLATNTFAFQSI